MDDTHLYVGAENMMFYKLSAADGGVVLSTRVAGQSFHTQWPVVFSSFVFVEASPIPAIGSEWAMEEVMDEPGNTSIAVERSLILRWLSGDTNGGRWPDASPDWKHFTVLRKADFTEPYVVADGPFDGCGSPPPPPVVDNKNRLIKYWKSKFRHFARENGFGSYHEIDISSMNLTNGYREILGDGTPSDEWYTWESDNLYGMTVGGDWLYLRQNFRGTIALNLTRPSQNDARLECRYQDPGWYNGHILYTTGGDGTAVLPQATMRAPGRRAGPTISGSRVYFTQPWCLVAVEHHQ
jgi:hypothetical protein